MHWRMWPAGVCRFRARILELTAAVCRPLPPLLLPAHHWARRRLHAVMDEAQILKRHSEAVAAVQQPQRLQAGGSSVDLCTVVRASRASIGTHLCCRRRRRIAARPAGELDALQVLVQVVDWLGRARCCCCCCHGARGAAAVRRERGLLLSGWLVKVKALLACCWIVGLLKTVVVVRAAAASAGTAAQFSRPRAANVSSRATREGQQVRDLGAR